MSIFKWVEPEGKLLWLPKHTQRVQDYPSFRWENKAKQPQSFFGCKTPTTPHTHTQSIGLALTKPSHRAGTTCNKCDSGGFHPISCCGRILEWGGSHPQSWGTGSPVATCPGSLGLSLPLCGPGTTTWWQTCSGNIFVTGLIFSDSAPLFLDRSTVVFCS